MSIYINAAIIDTVSQGQVKACGVGGLTGIKVLAQANGGLGNLIAAAGRCGAEGFVYLVRRKGDAAAEEAICPKASFSAEESVARKAFSGALAQ